MRSRRSNQLCCQSFILRRMVALHLSSMQGYDNYLVSFMCDGFGMVLVVPGNQARQISLLNCKHAGRSPIRAHIAERALWEPITAHTRHSDRASIFEWSYHEMIHAYVRPVLSQVLRLAFHGFNFRHCWMH